MNLLKSTDVNVEISMTESELLILNAALNEICNGIDIAEFETRIGADKKVATTLLADIGNILDKINM